MPIEPNVGNRYGFPALDFKLKNDNSRTIEITRVNLVVSNVSIDHSPVLECSLACKDGDLYVVILNYGWGGASEFWGSVDVSSLFNTQRAGQLVEIQSQTIPTAADENFGMTPRQALFAPPPMLRRKVFKILSHAEVDPETVHQDFKLEEEQIERRSADPENRHLWYAGDPLLQREIRFSGEFRYGSIDSNCRIAESIEIRRVQRGLYDLRNIHYFANRFEYINYDPTICAKLTAPSCVYHFLLKPEDGPRVYERSVLHEIAPGELDRIWLVLASEKSAIYDLHCSFLTTAGEMVESVRLRIHIWAPLNSEVKFAQALNEISFPVNYRSGKSLELPVYDVQSEKARKTRVWVY